MLDKFHIPYSYKEQKGKLNFGNTEIICGSLDNYHVHEGIEVGWFWMDEAGKTKMEAFLMLMARNRHPNAKKLEGWCTTTPFGFNWLFDYFKGDKTNDEFAMFKSKSSDNKFLPAGYVESLKESYDEKIYAQEVLGEFMNVSMGRIYYGFDRNKHVKPVSYKKDTPIYIGMDFNINPMTAVILQTYDDHTYVIDEFYIMTSNTHEMGGAIAERYGRGHSIIPDSTGKALKTASAGLSDHQILQQKGFKILGSHNPFRVDRYNCVNNTFEKGKITIDPKCKKLIKDLEQVSYKEGSSLPDTSQKDLTHISDALGYALYWKYPIFKPRSGIVTMAR